MTFRCTICRGTEEVPITEGQYKRWRDGKELIQVVMPELTPDQRELVLSGTCGPCFDSLFPPDQK